MVATYKLVAEVECQDALGEGLVWDHRTGEFLWTDIEGKRFHRYQLETGKHVELPLEKRLGSFGLTSDPKRLISASENEIAWLDRDTGQTESLHVLNLPNGVRFNDGRMGPDGAFWVGTMVEDADAAGSTHLGILYRIGANLVPVEQFGGIRITNGLCWSPRADTLYHADSPHRRVRRFAFDVETGRLTMPHTSEFLLPKGGPDGAVTDAEGRYWSAIWSGSRVACLDPKSGTELGAIQLPVPLITCPCFGGPELKHLAVTTAHVELSPEDRAKFPRSGNLFIFKTSIVGTQQSVFGG